MGGGMLRPTIYVAPKDLRLVAVRWQAAEASRKVEGGTGPGEGSPRPAVRPIPRSPFPLREEEMV